MKRFLKVVLVCSVLSAMTLGAAPPAAALDRGDMGLLSPDNPVIEKSFPAIAGQMAPNNNPPHPNAYNLKAQYIVKSCRDRPPAAYCDVIKFKLDNGPHTELYFVRITLSWANATSNNMDFFLWPDEWVYHTQSDCCGVQVGQAWSATKHPEVLKVGEPVGTDNPATRAHNESIYWLTVVNYSGLNSGYTVKLEWSLEDLGTFPSFTRNRGGATLDEGGAKTGTAAKSDGPSYVTTDTGEAAGPPVKVPGEDGELVERELPVLVQGSERRAEEGGMGALVWIVIALLVGGLSTFGVLFLRRKRAAESF